VTFATRGTAQPGPRDRPRARPPSPERGTSEHPRCLAEKEGNLLPDPGSSMSLTAVLVMAAVVLVLLGSVADDRHPRGTPARERPRARGRALHRTCRGAAGWLVRCGRRICAARKHAARAGQPADSRSRACRTARAHSRKRVSAGKAGPDGRKDRQDSKPGRRRSPGCLRRSPAAPGPPCGDGPPAHHILEYSGTAWQPARPVSCPRPAGDRPGLVCPDPSGMQASPPRHRPFPA
jgi:hypothetical protein